jgi:3-hydroxyisobutyrate dehydrogenase-like beta-hydroxyacid dehydrogenase
MSARPVLGLVGLGNMGGRIARRLTAGGETVWGFDLDTGAVDRSTATPAGSVGTVMAEADLVFLSLPDSSVVEPLVLGADGILANCREGQVVVDLSTSSPDSTRRIHEQLARRDVEYLDAGISGGAKAAEAGTLTVMVGGSAAALDRVRPALSHFAAHVHHMGGSGAGHTTKLLNNFLNGVSLATTAEVMVAARKAGLDLPQLLDVINASSGVNFATLERFPKIVRGDYLEGGLTVDLMAKDIRLYLELLRELELESQTGSATLGCFELASSLGYGDQISNRVVDALGDVAGGIRVSAP